jgi:glycosyltransferase involved in cell wall biosynthesis
MTLFFVINQDLFDGSAHALYCYRNCWWLAKAAPTGCRVELIFAGSSRWRVIDDSGRAAAHFQLGESLLRVTALPAWRKRKHGKGFTFNAWFHHHAAAYLAANVAEKDIFVTASFPKLLRFLAGRSALVRRRLRWIYEVHQLAVLDVGKDSSKVAAEKLALDLAQAFVTTTNALASLLEESFPTKPWVNIGLACGELKAAVPPPPPHDEWFTLGYIGSVYPGQGIDWLVENWRRIRDSLGCGARLIIAGGGDREVAALRKCAEEHDACDVEFLGKVSQAEIPTFLARVNALIIPSTNAGRMPYVAITKAYDYLTYRRPVIASAIPSITEVMRSGVEALTFHPCSVEGLAECAKRLLTEPSVGGELVESAAARAGAHDWETRARKYWRWLFDSTM